MKKDNSEALRAFTCNLTMINARLDVLKAAASNHLGYASEGINWSHAETLKHIDVLLCEILDFLGKEV